MIRVTIPTNLRRLASTDSEVTFDLESPVTVNAVLDALESRYPMLRGTIRDHRTKLRRPYIRYFACGEDLSHEPTDTPLPDAVVAGSEPLRIVGAMSGG